MSELGPYEKMTNQEKREFFRNRETKAAMKPTLGTECSKCGHVHMSIVCSCGCDISGELLKPQAKMSQPENELRAALERMRDEAKHEEKVAKEHDDLGQHSWGFKRTAEALRRWTLVLETALASRAPATTPTLEVCKCYKDNDYDFYAAVMTGVASEWTVTEDCPIHRDAQAAAPGGHGFITGTAIPENFEPPLQDKPPGPRCSHGVLMREFCQGCEDAAPEESK